VKLPATICAVVAAIDQLTKWLVIRILGENEVVVVWDGFFRLVHWRNAGAAWGMFQGFSLILIIVSVATLAGLVLFRKSLHLEIKPAAWGIGLIAGGIVGNLVDRVRFGEVIDFLDFHIGAYHWPAFNVADSGICIGVAIYIISTWNVGKTKDSN
jgi:signal peptidase II